MSKPHYQSVPPSLAAVPQPHDAEALNPCTGMTEKPEITAQRRFIELKNVFSYW